MPPIPSQSYLRLASHPRVKVVIAWLVAALAVSPSATMAEAPQGFEFRELPKCSKRDPYTAPDSVSTKRIGARLVVLIETPMSCSSQVVPSVAFGQPKYISISLEERQSSSGPVAACACLRRFEVALEKPVPKGTVIYLVREGVARTHKSAA